VAQILQPLLDPRFDDFSLGYRPGRDRTEALARAIAISEREERYVWVVSDLKDAFNHVSHQYLLDTLAKDHWLDGLVPLVRRIIGSAGTTGIPQGGALSPFLLNVALHKAIDRRWKRTHPDIPLIRIADDVCLLCQTPAEAETAWNDLQGMATDIGMQVKGTSTTDCHNLTEGQRACWLGIEVRKEGPGIKLGLSPKFREKLKIHLVEQISQPDSLLAVGATLRGTFDQLGPLAEDGLTAALHETAKVLGQLQMETPVSPEELRTIWEKARTRYLARQEYYRLVSSTRGTSPQDASRGEGFAPRHRTRPDIPTDAGATAVAQATVELVTARLSNGMGAWLCATEDQQTQAPNIQCQSVGRVTATRLSLLGLLAALDNTTTQRIVVRTDSSYLCNLRLAYERLGETGREAEPRSARHPNQDLLVALQRKLQGSGRTLNFQFRTIPRGTSRANTAWLVPTR
jgi:ribonuclease HI